MRKILAQMLNVLSAERISVMRAMQDAFVAVQLHAHTGAGQLLDGSAEMMEQRLDLAPVDVRVDRVVEDRAKQVLVLVTHGG